MEDVIAEAGLTGSSYDRLLSLAEFKRFVLVRARCLGDTAGCKPCHLRLILVGAHLGEGCVFLCFM